MAPIEEQSWESFSRPWNVDVKIAFEVGRAVLARPLRRGSTVVIMSSGAGVNVNGSPRSGGYAGAKHMQIFLAHYLQQAADARDLGIRFVALAPLQLLVGTQIGEAAAAATAPRSASRPTSTSATGRSPSTPPAWPGRSWTSPPASSTATPPPSA